MERAGAKRLQVGHAAQERSPELERSPVGGQLVEGLPEEGDEAGDLIELGLSQKLSQEGDIVKRHLRGS